MVKDEVQLGAFLAHHAFDDRNALGTQQVEAMAGVGRVRVARTHNDGTDIGSQDRIDARRCKAMRAARLKRDVQDGIRGGLTA